MAYEKLKQELYKNVGGINEKASEYITGDNEVLSLKNLSFQRPGAWESRPGYSLYVNSGINAQVEGIHEFTKSTGYSALIYGVGNTLIHKNSTGVTVIGLSMAAKPIDFQTFEDVAYLCDGNGFFKFGDQSSTIRRFGVPTASFAISATYSTRTLAAPDYTVAESGTYLIKYAWEDVTGHIGPISTQTFYLNPGVTYARFEFTTGGTPFVSLMTPVDHGYSVIRWFQKGPTDPEYKTVGDGTGNAQYFGYFPFLANATATVAPYGPVGSENRSNPVDIVDVGATGFIPFVTYMPQFIENYNNMFAIGGFSGLASTTYFSENATSQFLELNPQRIKQESFFQSGTDNNEYITGYLVFQERLLVFKNNSVYEMIGDDPSSISQRKVTADYGCISNKAAVTFLSRCMFLDEKGIVEYNGVNVEIVSDKMEDTFKRMNVDYAKQEACAVHIKERNEVWFAIPLDASTKNNAVIVYDYLVNGWTVYEGFEASRLIVGRQQLSKNEVIWGGYSGSIFAFGESLASDAGAAITCSVKSKYHKRLGDSTQELWRRFYLNNSVASVTTPVTVKFRPNYGDGVSLTTTMYLDQFQNRIDLGLSAKTMSTEVIFSSATDRIVINGYAIESRYLRSV